MIRYKNRVEKHISVEMAIPRNEYIDKVDSRMWQIAQNYCLTLYAKEYCPDLYNHWKGELLGYFKAIRAFKPKSGNKYQIIRHEIIDAMELNKPVNVKEIMENKLDEENITMDFNKYYYQFAKHTESIIKCLSGEISLEDFIGICSL